MELYYSTTAFWSGSKILQKSVDQKLWTDQNQRTFDLFGRIKGRTLQKTKDITTFPFLPDAEYLLVYHDVKMEKKQRTVEVAVLRIEDGQWKVCSYSVRRVGKRSGVG